MFTLCQLLGYPHPDYMLDELTARQLDDWLAWMRRYHPFPNRNDPYFAMLCAAWYTDTKGQDFMIYDDPLAKFSEDISEEDFSAKLRSILPPKA